MIPSQACLDLIKASEGCRLESYQDGGGTWTIGYGHTQGVMPDQTCSQGQADQWLLDDANAAGAGVTQLVNVPLIQGQFDALTDFVFNLGYGALRMSTLLVFLNERNYAAAAEEFPQWVHCAGRVMPGLVTRRAAEVVLFNS